MIGVALIGAGRIGRIHARNVSDNDNARIIYVCDVVADAAAELANRYGGKAAPVDRILVDENVGAVIIASSTDTHAELIAQAAAAGKAIFCEKPLDLDVHRARVSVDIARTSNVLLCLGFNRRHDPDFEKLKAEVNSGSIGTIEVVSIVSRDPSPPPPEYVQRSGGLFRDMMIHDLDMGRWLLGEEPSQVFATGSALADPKIGNWVTSIPLSPSCARRPVVFVKSQTRVDAVTATISASKCLARRAWFAPAIKRTPRLKKQRPRDSPPNRHCPFSWNATPKRIAFSSIALSTRSADTVSTCRSVLMDCAHWNSQRLRRNRSRPVERSRSATHIGINGSWLP